MKLYAVQNQEGQWFRAKGFSGHGNSWVSELEKAKMYAKIGQARARVTFFYNKWPEFGPPNIVEFELKDGVVLKSELKRVIEQSRKNKKKKAEMEAKRLIREKESAEQNLRNAQKRLEQLNYKMEK